MSIRNYQTLSIATTELCKRDYTADFKLEDGKLLHTESGKSYGPKDMDIMEFHRFEGDSDPADNAIVYAVECKDGVKGLIVSAYGPYGSVALNEFMDEVEVHDKTEAAGPIHQ
jgi:hypothetical protein